MITHGSKFVLTGLLCLLLAACQTAGLKPGSVETSFAPAGWQKVSKGSKDFYVCPELRCKTTQVVAIVPAKVKGNAEEAIRNNIVSSGLLKEFGTSLGRASNGAFKLISNRRIVTSSYSGFESIMRLKAPGQRPIYVAERLIIQGDRGTSIQSISTNLDLTRRNLTNFMKQTTVRRF